MADYSDHRNIQMLILRTKHCKTFKPTVFGNCSDITETGLAQCVKMRQLAVVDDYRCHSSFHFGTLFLKDFQRS